MGDRIGPPVASGGTAGNAPERATIGATLRAYLALTKPRIIELLLVTTVPAMLLAQRTSGLDTPGPSEGLLVPSPWLVATTLLGGALAAGSANALNCVADADIDAIMRRTRSRPLAQHTVPVRSALVFGLVLGALSFGWLWATTNLLAAVLAVAAIAFYVLVYTLVLKRRTTQNIVWGGVAGCMPVVIGWAAVTGGVDWPALVMFGVIFFWTPPHFWALAMRYRDDYARAGVPMLPVVATPVQVSRQIVAYSWAMVAWSLLLVPVTSWLYAVLALGAGAWFLALAHRLHAAMRRGEPGEPMKLFHLSNSYLTALFVAIAIDAVLGLPGLAALAP